MLLAVQNKKHFKKALPVKIISKYSWSYLTVSNKKGIQYFLTRKNFENIKLCCWQHKGLKTLLVSEN